MTPLCPYKQQSFAADHAGPWGGWGCVCSVDHAGPHIIGRLVCEEPVGRYTRCCQPAVGVVDGELRCEKHKEAAR